MAWTIQTLHRPDHLPEMVDGFDLNYGGTASDTYARITSHPNFVGIRCYRVWVSQNRASLTENVRMSPALFIDICVLGRVPNVD